MRPFIDGLLVMSCLIAGLFFLRFWRQSRDRLFIFFAATFWLLGINWMALSFTREDETRTAFFIVRLLAFVVLIIGILDKNRAKPPTRRPNIGEK